MAHDWLSILTAGRRPAQRVAWLPLLCFCIAGCRSTKDGGTPLAFMFPTLYSTRILDTTTPLSVSAEQIEAVMRDLKAFRPLHQAGMKRTELHVVARGLRNRGYAELDARRSGSSVRWVSFRGDTPESEEEPVLVVTVGYWARPAGPRPVAGLPESRDPVSSKRHDPYGVPQNILSWRGEGPRAPVLRKVLNAFDGNVSHWEIEVTLTRETLDAMTQ